LTGNLVPAGGNNGLLAGQMVDENPSAGSEGDAEPSLKRLPTDYRNHGQPVVVAEQRGRAVCAELGHETGLVHRSEDARGLTEPGHGLFVAPGAGVDGGGGAPVGEMQDSAVSAAGQVAHRVPAGPDLVGGQKQVIVRGDAGTQERDNLHVARHSVGDADVIFRRHYDGGSHAPGGEFLQGVCELRGIGGRGEQQAEPHSAQGRFHCIEQVHEKDTRH
jgi:hypothetical protein